MTSLPRSDRPSHKARHLCRGAPCGRPGAGTRQTITGQPIHLSRPPFVIPAPAGIHAPFLRLRTPIAIPPTTTTRIPQNPASQSAIPPQACPVPDPAPDSTAGGGANHTPLTSPCGTAHRGLIVKPGTSCAGARSQPTARRQPRHRICSLSPWERVRVRVNKSPLRIRRPNKNRRHCRGDSRIAHGRVAAYPGHPLSTRAEPPKHWYNQTYVRLPHRRPLLSHIRTIPKTCFCKTKIQFAHRDETQPSWRIFD